MYCPTFKADAQHRIKEIGQADLVIGVPGGKDPQAAAHVARIALAGVYEHYPQLRTVLLNADIGRCGDIHHQFAGQIPKNGHDSFAVGGCYHGVSGLGSAAAAIMDAGLALDAKAIVILDSQTECLTADWVAALAHLVLENKADVVLPRYRQWLQPQGLLSDLLVYPLHRALWGQSVRHPAAMDFAVSPGLATALLDEDVWGTPAACGGLGPWLTAFATLGKWRVAQSAIDAKFQQSTLPPELFARQFRDIVSVMFSLIPRYCRGWQRVKTVQSAPTSTRFASSAPLLYPSPIDTEALLDKLALGWMKYRTLWNQILTKSNLAQVEQLATLSPDQFYFPADLWARIIYDFAVMFNIAEADPVQVVASLMPLYQARVAAFWNEIDGLALVGREGTVAAQAVEFEEMRDYLKIQWAAHQPRYYQSGWLGDRPL